MVTSSIFQYWNLRAKLGCRTCISLLVVDTSTKKLYPLTGDIPRRPLVSNRPLSFISASHVTKNLQRFMPYLMRSQAWKKGRISLILGKDGSLLILPPFSTSQHVKFGTKRYRNSLVMSLVRVNLKYYDTRKRWKSIRKTYA